MTDNLVEYLQEIAVAQGRPIPITIDELLEEARRELDALALIGCPAIADNADEREAFSAALYTEAANSELEHLKKCTEGRS